MSRLTDRTIHSFPNVAIIGGGVCGLGIGWKLAAAGCPVDVFDRGHAGRGASWAAAGMLAARAEAEPCEETLLDLNLQSKTLWPAFAAGLGAAAGRTGERRGGQEGGRTCRSQWVGVS